MRPIFPFPILTDNNGKHTTNTSYFKSSNAQECPEFRGLMAGAPGLEPGTYGFGDRRSTN